MVKKKVFLFGILIFLLVNVSLINASSFGYDTETGSFGYDTETGSEVTVNTWTGNLTNLSELQDIDVVGVNDNDVLTYNSATGKWEDQAPTAGSETDPLWTGNQSLYSTTATILGWGYYNLTDFNIANYILYSGATQNVNLGIYNITANWFKGKFNWTEISKYLSFDGRTLDFSEAELNSTIDLRTRSLYYNASLISTISGIHDGGNLDSIIFPEDDDTYNVSEDSGANPLIIVINFSNVNTFDSIVGRVYYDGGLGHTIQVEIQRADTGAWENYIDFTDTTDFVNIYIPVFDPEQHIFPNGDVAIRFNHVQSGIPTHNFYIDYLAIVEGWTTLTVADHDSLGGRNSPTNHPWALPTDGTRALTGNWQVGQYNITNISWLFVNDRVGIGTGINYPNSSLHVKSATSGTIGSHPAGQIIIQNPTDSVTSNVVITAYESDGDGNPDQQLWYLGSSSSGNSDIIFLNRRSANLHLGTGGSTRMTIKSGGDVGIGTTSPRNKLSVTTASASDPPALGSATGVTFSSLAGNIYGLVMGQATSGNVWMQSQRVDGTATGYHLLLQPTFGNVGIGTMSPNAKLEVTGDVRVFKSAGNLRILVGDGASTGQWGGLDWDSTSDYLQIMHSGYSASNGVINILSSGNVGIGTTTPQNKLNVIGDINFTGLIYGNGSQLTGLTLTESDPYWTGNQSLVYLKSNPFSFWNDTYALFNKTYADTLYYGLSNPYGYYNSTNPQTETDPYWTGNSTLVPYLASANTFTANNIFNQNLTVDTDTLFVDSNTDRVGIGMTEPTQKLDVAGAIKASGAIYGNRADKFAFYAISGGIYVAGLVDNYFAGNVGIGTTTPQQELNVIGDLNVTGDLFVENINISGIANYITTGTIRSFSNGCNEISNSTGLFWIC